MRRKILRYKKIGVTVLSSFLLLVSADAVAQKSVYDVIPGSGPKKTGSTLPEVIKGNEPNDNARADKHEGVYKARRTNLPPGQAKKRYGGSAKDYAPGQVKKKNDYRHGHHKKHGKHKYKKHYKD